MTNQVSNYRVFCSLTSPRYRDRLDQLTVIIKPLKILRLMMLAIDYGVVIGQGLLSHPKSLDKETDEHVDTLDTKVQRSNWVIGSSKVIDSSPPHSQPFYHEERWHSNSASRQLMVMAMNRNLHKFAVGEKWYTYRWET